MLFLSSPGVSFVITGCHNGYLIGAYNGQTSSLNLSNVFNTGAAQTTSGGTGGTTSGGTTGRTTTVGNGSGSAVATAELGWIRQQSLQPVGTDSRPRPILLPWQRQDRGQQTAASGAVSSMIGTYSVNNDCTASL